jgi:type II secretory pathway pseudopilin PulG
MLKNGKKLKALSLIEIVVSLAVFSFIFSIVIGISLMLVRAQTKVQAQIFLTQTAQTTIEDMSRNLRFGYAYSGGNMESYLAGNYNIRLDNNTIAQYGDRSRCVTKTDANGIQYQECPLVAPEDTVTNSQVVSNQTDSPFVVFENKDGNPTTYTDQNAYCLGSRADGTMTLYKLEKFSELHTGGAYTEDRCSYQSESAQDMLPEEVHLEYASFDVYGQSSENPINPMVRIKLKISSELGGSLNIQTTVTQRLRANIL